MPSSLWCGFCLFCLWATTFKLFYKYTKLFRILGPCAYCSLSPRCSAAPIFLYGCPQIRAQASPCRWMLPSVFLPCPPQTEEKISSLCAHNTWYIYLLLDLSHFIAVKCAFRFLPHYIVNPLEAEMIFIQFLLGFLGLSLWAPLLQNMKHNPLVGTQHNHHII